MYFPDLTTYSYATRGKNLRDEVLNVGWLDNRHEFARSEPSDALTAALWSFCSLRLIQSRGWHDCLLCSYERAPFEVRRGDETQLLGTAEMRAFGPHGEVYAAPDLIYHYVIEHHYAPPEAFVDAVLHGPQPGTEEYERRVATYRDPWASTSE